MPQYLLSLDTVSSVCSLALYKDRKNIASCELENTFTSPLTGSLPEVLKTFLETNQVDQAQLTAIVVNRGPGSFTGVRFGMAFAKGYSFGLGVPVWGVSSFQSLMHQHREKMSLYEKTLLLIDTKCNSFYTAVVEGGDVYYSVLKPDEVLSQLTPHTLIISDQTLSNTGLSEKQKEGVILSTAHARWSADYIVHHQKLAVFETLVSEEPFYLKALDY